MKRKVNRVGTNTLTVSLPAKWVKAQGIEAGDELDVTEEGKQIVLGTSSRGRKKSTTIDVRGKTGFVHLLIAAAYKAGYDEVDIFYQTAEELADVQERIDNVLAEFDVVEHKKNKLKIKAVLRVEPEMINVFFRKTFHTFLDISKELEVAIHKKDFDYLHTLVLRDKTLDKYADYSRRILNKGLNDSFKVPHSVYYIIEQIEIIGDLYKEMALHVAGRKLTVGKDVQKLLQETNHFTSLFVKMFFDFSPEKMKDFLKKKNLLKRKVDSLLEKAPRGQLKLVLLLGQIYHSTYELKSALLTETT